MLTLYGFGQDDCGKKPKTPSSFNNPQYQQSSEYREYREQIKIYKKCLDETLFNNIGEPLPLAKNTGLITFEGIINAESLTVNEIYYGLKEWFASSNTLASNYSDQNILASKKIFEVDDIESGLIMTQMQHEIRADNTAYIDGKQEKLKSRKKQFWIKYNIKFEIREGRFKYTITNFSRDYNLVNNIKTLGEKRKRFFRKRKPLAYLEELVIDKLYKEDGELDKENAFLKLKLLNIYKNLEVSLQNQMQSKSEIDKW